MANFYLKNNYSDVASGSVFSRHKSIRLKNRNVAQRNRASEIAQKCAFLQFAGLPDVPWRNASASVLLVKEKVVAF